MASPLPKAKTLASLFLLLFLLDLTAAPTAFAWCGHHRRRHHHHHKDWDFARGAEEEDAYGKGWERQWGQGSAPDGKGAFDYSATKTGGGKSFSFGWSKGGDGVARGGSAFAGNWKPNDGGAKAEKK